MLQSAVYDRVQVSLLVEKYCRISRDVLARAALKCRMRKGIKFLCLLYQLFSVGVGHWRRSVRGIRSRSLSVADSSSTLEYSAVILFSNWVRNSCTVCEEVAS